MPYIPNTAKPVTRASLQKQISKLESKLDTVKSNFNEERKNLLNQIEDLRKRPVATVAKDDSLIGKIASLEGELKQKDAEHDRTVQRYNELAKQAEHNYDAALDQFTSLRIGVTNMMFLNIMAIHTRADKDIEFRQHLLDVCDKYDMDWTEILNLMQRRPGDNEIPIAREPMNRVVNIMAFVNMIMTETNEFGEYVADCAAKIRGNEGFGENESFHGMEPPMPGAKQIQWKRAEDGSESFNVVDAKTGKIDEETTAFVKEKMAALDD